MEVSFRKVSFHQSQENFKHLNAIAGYNDFYLTLHEKLLFIQNSQIFKSKL